MIYLDFSNIFITDQTTWTIAPQFQVTISMSKTKKEVPENENNLLNADINTATKFVILFL